MKPFFQPGDFEPTCGYHSECADAAARVANDGVKKLTEFADVAVKLYQHMFSEFTFSERSEAWQKRYSELACRFNEAGKAIHLRPVWPKEIA